MSGGRTSLGCLMTFITIGVGGLVSIGIMMGHCEPDARCPSSAARNLNVLGIWVGVAVFNALVWLAMRRLDADDPD